MKNNKNNIAVIIPAFNEYGHIKDVIVDVSRYIKNIIIVDDGSTDQTSSFASKNAKVLHHVVNLGKGAALKTGTEYAARQGYSRIIFMDADKQHRASDLPLFIEALRRYDLVLGYRDLKKYHHGIRYIGNKINSYIIKILFGADVKDPICGYRGFNLRIYHHIKWESLGYGVETEIIIKAIKNKLPFFELETEAIYLDKYKGVNITNAYTVFFDMLKWRLIS